MLLVFILYFDLFLPNSAKYTLLLNNYIYYNILLYDVWYLCDTSVTCINVYYI
jgi:hypothetical protein